MFWLATQLLVVLVHRMERNSGSTRHSSGTRVCLNGGVCRVLDTDQDPMAELENL